MPASPKPALHGGGGALIFDAVILGLQAASATPSGTTPPKAIRLLLRSKHQKPAPKLLAMSLGCSGYSVLLSFTLIQCGARVHRSVRCARRFIRLKHTNGRVTWQKILKRNWKPRDCRAQKAVRIAGLLKIGLIGFGTVGRSVAKILTADPNGPLRLTHICNRNISAKKIDGLPSDIRWTENADEVLSSGVDVMVDSFRSSGDAAEGWIRKALQSGKSVVTANKLLISERGAELAELARRMGRRLEYGASVAGGIPAIIGIQEGLAGDRLYRIAGILNGTCNYILTQMEAHGASFDSALKEAQKLGYAEADPTSDVEGYDARAKLVILTQAGLHLRVKQNRFPAGPFL